MNKVKIVIYIAALLIVINVALLGFNYLKPHPPKHHKADNPKSYIINKLNFNEAQAKQFEALIPEHRETIDKIERELRENKQALFNTILENKNSRDSILSEIGKKQIEIEKVHLAHFEDIKSICTKEQIPDFEALIKEMQQIFVGPKGRKEHPPR